MGQVWSPVCIFDTPSLLHATHVTPLLTELLFHGRNRLWASLVMARMHQMDRTALLTIGL